MQRNYPVDVRNKNTLYNLQSISNIGIRIEWISYVVEVSLNYI